MSEASPRAIDCRVLAAVGVTEWDLRGFHLKADAAVYISKPRERQRRYCSFHYSEMSTIATQNEKPGSRRETKLFSLALPAILATVVVTQSTDTYYNNSVFIDTFNDWMMPEKMTKDLYMLISMAFCWGCCVFGSMTDPFYESDDYRGAGGNGTNHWIYDVEEIEEIENREELFREALVKEIEGKVGEMRELEGAGKDREKEKELV